MSDGLRIELDAGTSPITGRICPATGEPLPFSGYVELIAVLEGLRGAEHRPDPEQGADSPALA